MNTGILSNITQQEDQSKLLRFAIIFIGKNDKTEEFVFIGYSLTDCVMNCTALINYMFQFQRMQSVYIYPIDCTQYYRTVYGRSIERDGAYRVLECQVDSWLTLAYVRSMFPLN